MYRRARLQFGHGFSAVEIQRRQGRMPVLRGRLQFGHGFSAGEIRSHRTRRRRPNDPASIRPRLQRRGDVVSMDSAVLFWRMLQFGHGFSAVEMVPIEKVTPNSYTPLQFGHGF